MFGDENDVYTLTNVNGEVVAQVTHGLEDRIYLLSGRVVYSKPLHLQASHAAFPADSDELILVVATSDVNTPVEVFSTAASGGALVQLSNHGAVLKDRKFGSCHFFQCPSLDKEVELDGIFLTPSASPPQKPQPAIVLVHGGPTDRNTNRFDGYYYYWAPFLLAHGFSVVLTNYRGSTGKGEAFTSYSQRGCGKWDYEDVIAITDKAVNLGWADKDRLMVGGVSQGGFLSFLSSTRNGSISAWKFKAAVPVAGVSDCDTMAMTSDLGGSLELELNAYFAPWKMAKTDTRTRQASAIWEFEAAMQRSRETKEMVVPPMLIMHGENDPRCPLTQAWGMRRALDSQGLPYEFITYPRQPHIFTEQKFWIDMAERLLRWCTDYIGPGELA